MINSRSSPDTLVVAKSTLEFLQVNPKRVDTKSYERYEAYKAATSLEEMLSLGGTRADYKHDREKGFIRLEGEADFAPRDDKPARPAGGPPAAAKQPRTKKVRSAPPAPAPRAAGFVLFCKVDSRVIVWDPKTFEGRSPAEIDAARDENNVAARARDGCEVLGRRVYGDLESANAAALDLIVRKVGELAVDGENGVLRPAEDMIVPTENTIRNGCSTAENGSKQYRTNVSFVVDALKTGVENMVNMGITVKTIYQSG